MELLWRTRRGARQDLSEGEVIVHTVIEAALLVLQFLGLEIIARKRCLIF